jgi:peroxiredoxin Q/BCP
MFLSGTLDFSESLKDFEKMNAVILWVSPDSTKSHTNFAAKHNLKIKLLSDP